MKRKSITIYTVLISLIFIFCLCFFSYNLIYEFNHGEARTKKSFDFITKSIRINGDKTNFEKLFEKNDDYEAILVMRDSKPLFVYPHDLANKQIKAESTKFVKFYEKKIQTSDAEYEIKLAMYILRPAIIFYYAKFTFLTVLGATIFAFILIIFYQVTGTKKLADSLEEEGKKEAENSIDDLNLPKEELLSTDSDFLKEESSTAAETKEIATSSNNATSPATGTVTETTSETGVSASTVTREGSATENSNTSIHATPASATTTSVTDNTSASSDSAAPNGSAAQEEYKVPETPISSTHETEINENSENEASLMFSAKTGFSNESQLKSRLETEIVRAASEEQDVSLIIARIPGLDFTSEDGQKVSKLVLSEVPFRNLVFDYKEDGFALISKNMTIENAEVYSETLLSKIREALSDKSLVCAIGISSRSIRIVSEGRMITEAEEALKHSFEDKDSMITAFHVDVEKYREFLRNQE